jgi:ABC-type oligopeptide transport system substrate-binding subunit
MAWKISGRIIMVAAIAGIALTACKGKKTDTGGDNVVNARELSDPDMLNPIKPYLCRWQVYCATDIYGPRGY